MTTIRLMTSDDYQGVYQLWLSCTGMGLNNLDDSQAGIEKFLRRNPTSCFVATMQERIVGSIMSGHDGRRGFIYHASVHPDYRHQGIATQLIDAALAALKEEGIAKVAFVVFARNKEGNAFWERLGFQLRDDLVYRDKTLIEFERFDT